MPSRKHYPLKLVGQSQWFGGAEEELTGPTPVNRAILRTEYQLVFDCDVDGYKYDVHLTSTDGIRFTGRFSGRWGDEEWHVRVEAKLYSNSQGYLLYGQWLEGDGEYLWWTELSPVAGFSDEV